MMKPISIFPAFLGCLLFLFVNATAQTNPCQSYKEKHCCVSTKVEKQFFRKIRNPLVKSSEQMKNGSITFVEKVYGDTVLSKTYTLSWTTKLYSENKPFISLKTNEDSIFYYTLDSVFLYDTKSQTMLHSGSYMIYKNFLKQNLFLTFYVFGLEMGGKACEIKKLHKQGKILYADYLVPFCDVNEDYPYLAGEHRFTLDKSSNLLLQYSFEPCDPKMFGFYKKTYTIINYQPFIYFE